MNGRYAGHCPVTRKPRVSSCIHLNLCGTPGLWLAAGQGLSYAQTVVCRCAEATRGGGWAGATSPRNSPSCPAGPGSLLGRSRPGQGPLCPSPSWYRIWTDCRSLSGPPGPCRAPH